MKKLIYIVFGVLLFTALSCKKEVIQPNTSSENKADTEYQREHNFNQNSNDNNNKTNQSGTTNNVNGTTQTDTTHVITDPNRDEDDIRKDRP